MGATPERAVQVMFTSPYAALYLGVYGPKDTAVTGAGQLGIAANRGDQGHDPGSDPDRDGAAGEHRPLRGRHDVEHRLPLGPDRSLGDAEHDRRDDRQEEPGQKIELKFKLRNSPAHMAMRQGDFALLRWLDTYIFLIRANGELQRLHRTWLGEDMGDVPVL